MESLFLFLATLFVFIVKMIFVVILIAMLGCLVYCIWVGLNQGFMFVRKLFKKKVG